MNGKLPLFMRHAAEREIVWGQWDCALWLADWFMYATGEPDPVPEFRGRYHDEASANALFGPLGYPRLVQRIAERIGLSRTRDPMRGDIAIIRTKPRPAVGAIRITRGWALAGGMAGTRGISSLPDIATPHVLRAWRMPDA